MFLHHQERPKMQTRRKERTKILLSPIEHGIQEVHLKTQRARDRRRKDNRKRRKNKKIYKKKVSEQKKNTFLTVLLENLTCLNVES